MLGASRGILEAERNLKPNLKKSRKILRRSSRGGFSLFVDSAQIRNIDLDKKTKLWLSSPFLLEESFTENPERAEKTVHDLLSWNEKQERYRECERLSEMLKNLKQR